MNRRTFLVAAGAGTGVALAGCLEGSEAAGDHDVGMTISSFRPEELTVEAGTAVEFLNTSDHSHTVTAYQGLYPDGAEYWASGGFDSQDAAIDNWQSTEQRGKLEPGESYEHTFELPGTYEYYCIPHERSNMVGTIVAEEPTSEG
jgi:plastocyanin